MKDLSFKAAVYVLVVIVTGAILAGYYLMAGPVENFWAVALLSSLGSLALIFKVLGTTDRSHYNLSFLIYGISFVLLGIQSTIIVVILANIVDWAWHKYPKWYIQPFNVATYVIGLTLAHVVSQWVNPSGALFDFSGILAVLLAVTLFVVVNHFLVGLVIWLARGQNFRESGIFNFLPLMIDITMFAMGVTVAWVWWISPPGVILILVPLYLIYSTLRMPALERKTEIDPKTEVFNARYFNEALQEELNRATRFKRPLSIIMADLDLLREVNNTYGHLAGDIALQGIAKILKENVQDYGIVARFGGEEFAVILPEKKLEEATAVGEQLRQAIEQAAFSVSTSIKPISVTMSFGVASRNGETLSPQELIHRADLALYQAKANGRNRCYAFGQDQIAPVTASPENIAEIKQASECDEPATFTQVQREPQTGEPETQMSGSVVTPLKTNVTAKQYIPWYVAFVTTVAFLSSSIVLLVQAHQKPYWVGILVFSLLAFLAEIFSLEVYVRKTSVSTSVTILVAGTLLFGPAAAVILGIVAAFGALTKNRSPIIRFVFNASNFVIGNLLVLGVLAIVGKPFLALSIPAQLLLSITSIMIVYFSTTLLVSVVLRLQTGRSVNKIWQEQYRWLTPYYLVMGLVVFVLGFDYQLAGLLGIIVIFLPLLLLRFSQKQYLDHTRVMVHELQNKNKELTDHAAEISLLNEEMLLTLARSIDLRDPYVMEHSRHVARYAMLMANELDLPPEQKENIRKAGLLHDIGKLGIPESVLFKPEALLDDEYELVKRHVEIGADLIDGCHSLRPLIPYVLYHHERYDGQGYPAGLTGEEIPFEARIICLADAVEAMASDRPYSKAKTADEILAEIKRQTGKQFDPQICAAFTQMIEKQGKEIIVNSARTIETRLDEPRVVQDDQPSCVYEPELVPVLNGVGLS